MKWNAVFRSYDAAYWHQNTVCQESSWIYRSTGEPSRSSERVSVARGADSASRYIEEIKWTVKTENDFSEPQDPFLGLQRKV